jgi:hypothetical protein
MPEVNGAYETLTLEHLRLTDDTTIEAPKPSQQPPPPTILKFVQYTLPRYTDTGTTEIQGTYELGGGRRGAISDQGQGGLRQD